MGKRAKGRLSIRQWVISALTLGLVVITGILIFSTEYTANQLKKETAEQYLNILNMQRETIDDSLSNASASLLAYHISGTYMGELIQAADRNEAYFAVANISRDLENQILGTTISEFAFVRKKTGNIDFNRISLGATNSFTSREKLDIDQYVRTLDMQSAGTDYAWKPCLIGNEWYFMYNISERDFIIGQGLRVKTLVNLYSMLSDENSGILLLNDEDVSLVDFPGAVADNLLLSNGISRSETVMLQENKLVVNSYSKNLQRPVFFVKEGLLSQQFESWIRLLRMTMIAIFIVYFWTFGNIYKAILVPIKELQSCIGKIKDGNLETRIVVSANVPREFLSVYATLNEMTMRIEALKIASYESELKRKQSEIQFLASQIEPHFFLNAMKYIYALAQTRQYEQVQAIVITLSGYYRYLTYDSGKRVTLQKELEHVDYYLGIINAGSSNHVNVSISMDSVLERVLVPKLLIQTFVENSVKHGGKGREDLNIEIEVRKYGEGEDCFLLLRISDDGSGFEEGYLARVREKGLDSVSGHVGLFNLQHRLELLYPAGQTFLSIDNNENGGATVEIIMPAVTEEGIQESVER